MGCTSIAPPFHGGNTQFAADGLPVVLIGLNDLVEMAQSKGDTATATWAANKSAALTAKFVQDWWIQADGLFADSLALPQQVSTDPTATTGTVRPYTQFQQLYWTNATPMETGIAPAQDAVMAFANPNHLESSVFTGTTGYYQEGQSLPQIQGSRQAPALNTGGDGSR
jgi:hypothetical protein